MEKVITAQPTLVATDQLAMTNLLSVNGDAPPTTQEDQEEKKKKRDKQYVDTWDNSNNVGTGTYICCWNCDGCCRNYDGCCHCNSQGSDVNDGINVSNGEATVNDNNDACCDGRGCDCGDCECCDCNCGDCDCGDCDCGDCDCGDCDCGDCDCDCGDCDCGDCTIL